MWGGQGQGDPYAMQRPPMGGAYQMGIPQDPILHMRQEQMIQAQQAHRMQQQAAGGMYPPPGVGGGHPPGYDATPSTWNAPRLPPNYNEHGAHQANEDALN